MRTLCLDFDAIVFLWILGSRLSTSIHSRAITHRAICHHSFVIAHNTPPGICYAHTSASLPQTQLCTSHAQLCTVMHSHAQSCTVMHSHTVLTLDPPSPE